MKWKVLITAPYFLPAVETYRNEFDVHNIEITLFPVKERMTETDLLKVMSDIDGVICGDDPFTERVLQNAPKLKTICKWGTGIDSIDQNACQKRGISVCRTPNAFSHPVADSVMAYALCFSRRTLWMDKDMKAGIWQKIPGMSLGETTFGIIGMGNIGKQVAKRLLPFGPTILGTDIQPIEEDFCRNHNVRMVSLETLLQQCDFVSLNCDLNPTSRHIINSETLNLMKPTAVLINTARGGLVHTDHLVTALTANTIFGAALDVFEDEPLSSDHPLLKMDNVLTAPHNSNSSPSAWQNVHNNTLLQLFRELDKHNNSDGQSHSGYHR